MNQELQNKITEQLSQDSIHKVILFGSQATGVQTADSDIDLLVVTKDQKLPDTFKEKMEIYNKVYFLLKDLKKKHTIDLLVYPQPLFEKFINSGSMFSQEIKYKGKILYEKHDD